MVGSSFVHSHACKNCKTVKTGGGVKCREMIESVIPHFIYSRHGWFVSSFIHMSAKNAKQFYALLEGHGEKGRDTYIYVTLCPRDGLVDIHYECAA